MQSNVTTAKDEDLIRKTLFDRRDFNGDMVWQESEVGEESVLGLLVQVNIPTFDEHDDFTTHDLVQAASRTLCINRELTKMSVFCFGFF